MKNNYLSILFIFVFALSYGQKETANWFFGEFAGLNFSTKNPLPLVGKLATREGCAAISNDKGALLFYTDGSTIFNRNHDVMPNGDELFGNNSSSQSAIIIPKPLDNNIYYVFTVDDAEKFKIDELQNGLSYSIVDMNLDNGNGDVVVESKNTHLITYDQNDIEESDWKCSEKIAASLHADDTAFWVVTYFVDNFYAFKIDENGLSETPIISKVNDRIPIVAWQDPTTGAVLANVSSLGYLKISPNGKKIGIAHSFTAKNRVSGKAFLYDFDNLTGTVSPVGKQLISATFPYGIEFSPKSRKLYITTSNYVTIQGIESFEGSNLYQFNVEAPNILSSKVEINNSVNLVAGALQLALNGRIYRAKSRVDGGVASLAVINKPELDGNAANYEDVGVRLASNTFSRFGLPPFISSSFILTFDYEFTCLGDDTHFFITSEDPYDTLEWDFGDGKKSTDPEPYHRYDNPGEYTVKLTTCFNGFCIEKPLEKKVDIIARVDVVSPYTFIECDVDENTTDGITTFNLQLANDPISMGNGSEVNVYYYKDLATLEIDTLNIKALPNFYKNKIQNEPLFAKVVKSGSDCYSVADVFLKATKTIEFTSGPLIGCNQGDGTAAFDLGTHKGTVIAELSLEPTTKVTYYSSKNKAALGDEPLDENYNGDSSTIFIRLENDNICSGIGQMDLEMTELPNINLDEVLDICMDDFPTKINSGIDLSERQNYTYEWLSGENTYEIEAQVEGEYYVTITDKRSLCSIVKSIDISTVNTPIVKRIELKEENGSHSATVLLEQEGDFEFSLENQFGPYQLESFFNELLPGSYTVFIRDWKNCTLVEKKFFIFGFPKFFTPNSDGESDVWEVKGLNPIDFNYSNIQIFNRFGKLIASIPANGYWDGTYKGRTLPSDDYWFSVTVTDSDNVSTKYIKHFSLIRN